jgi:hypothetical protein
MRSICYAIRLNPLRRDRALAAAISTFRGGGFILQRERLRLCP